MNEHDVCWEHKSWKDNISGVAELDDNRMHPARSAPRCLPCHYKDPLQDAPTSNDFDAPQVQPPVVIQCY